MEDTPGKCLVSTLAYPVILTVTRRSHLPAAVKTWVNGATSGHRERRLRSAGRPCGSVRAVAASVSGGHGVLSTAPQSRPRFHGGPAPEGRGAGLPELRAPSLLASEGAGESGPPPLLLLPPPPPERLRPVASTSEPWDLTPPSAGSRARPAVLCADAGAPAPPTQSLP